MSSVLNGVVYLSNARLSFPHFVEPQISKSPETGQERKSWNCELLVDPNGPDWQRFWAQCNAVAVEKWKENAQTVMQMIMAERKNRCFAKGEEKINKKTFKPYDTHVGLMAISAGRDSQPQMIQPDGKPVDPANTMVYQAIARGMYAGCRVNVALKPWAQNNKHGVAIRCDLVAIQFAGHDTPFSAATVDVTPLFGTVAAAPAGTPTPAGMATPFDTVAAAPAAMPAAPSWMS